jgi:dienelactone hydrolase
VRVWLMAALGAVSVVAVAATPMPVTFPSRDLDPATGRPVELRALLFLPERAAGRTVPAVVALHGCGGMYSIVKARRDELSMRHRTMAGLLVTDGFHGFDGLDGQRLRFDVPGGVHPGQGVTVASNPAARDDAYARTRAFLRAELGAMRNQQSKEE